MGELKVRSYVDVTKEPVLLLAVEGFYFVSLAGFLYLVCVRGRTPMRRKALWVEKMDLYRIIFSNSEFRSVRSFRISEESFLSETRAVKEKTWGDYAEAIDNRTNLPRKEV